MDLRMLVQKEQKMNNFEIRFELNKDIYSKEALLKAAFSFVNRAYIHLDQDDAHWIVTAHSKQNDGNLIPSDFENELLAQEVRLTVYRKTHYLREILLARAMASSLVSESDPKKQIHEDEASVSDEELSRILKDWYNVNEN